MTRERLAQRRASQTLDLEHAGLHYTVTLSLFPDGRLAECFVQNHKLSSAADVAARDSGILLSLLFQFGCPVETIAHAITRNSDGSPSGVVGAILDKIMTLSGEFVIELQAPSGTDGIRALRAILKALLRRYGWRCIGAREEPIIHHQPNEEFGK